MPKTFLTKHYWGYKNIGNNRTSEYEVEHPKWDIYNVKDYSIDFDFGIVYGDSFKFLNQAAPKSVILAEGSEIKVNTKRVMEAR
ncbi:MAG: DUF2071 domain-containing protein [Flavobacteriales bacterium]